MTSAAAPHLDQAPRSSSPSERRHMFDRLVAKPHPPDATIGIPYFDEELQMPQSPAHFRMVHDRAQRLGQVAEQAGLEIEVLTPEAWSEGRKLRVFYRGARVTDAGEERRAREAAEEQAAAQQRARETAEQRAAQAQVENERLQTLLRQAGIDPR